MLVVSMLSPTTLRRLGVLAFLCSFVALALLPLLGTDFGKGAVRWYSLGFVSVQPSEFLKPTFAIFAAWLMAASYEASGPPGRALSFAVAVTPDGDAGAAAGLRPGRARSSPPGG